MTLENDGLYIALISPHGLIRSHDLELGKDADTGGQIKYVIELAQALAQQPEVARVDLMTRQIIDDDVDNDYSAPTDQICEGAYIIRIPFGPKRYLRKEVLWPYLDTFIDRSLKHFRQIGLTPDIIHSHYADGGFVGSHISAQLGVPFIHTGHSLGRDKQQRLLAQGVKPESIESRYNIACRIEAEEHTLDMADLVIASTRQEIEEQYQLYDNHEEENMRVIPPGVELKRFHPPGRLWKTPPIVEQVQRFLKDPGKPIILALARADKRKNVSALVTAFGESAQLRDMANLVILVGNRDDISVLPREQKEVLQEVFYLVDKYDLYGSVAYPKQHEPEDVPVLYRAAARSRGVFVNPALTEPFGLTIIEAAASGLPVIATQHGGPIEIIENCKNGLLIDPLNTQDIAQTLITALSDRSQWLRWSRSGIEGAQRYYSWQGHATNYLREANKLIKQHSQNLPQNQASKSRMTTIDRLLICDIDNTLIGDGTGLKKLLERIQRAGPNVGLGVATGRHLPSALQALVEWEVPMPDVIITSVGSEIHFHNEKGFDDGWRRLINHRWDPDTARDVISNLPGITLQPKSEQRPYKISYFIDPSVAPSISDIKRELRQHNIHANVVYSHDIYLDLLPVRASKGLAIRYVADKWDIPVENILVAGDSGNDEDMLRGDTLSVVVANHSSELRKLRGRPRIYFSDREYAWGIDDALTYYNFLGDIDSHDELDDSINTEGKMSPLPDTEEA